MPVSAPRHCLDVIENYFGVELTQDVIQPVAKSPASHLTRLFDELGFFYDDWLQRESGRRQDEMTDVFLCMSEWSPGWSWERSIDHSKNVTLFFPRASVLDPVSTLNRTPITFATELAKLGDDEGLPENFIDDMRRTDLERSLRYLLELAPLVRRGDLLLFPGSFALENVDIDRCVDDEMRSLTPEDVARYGPEIDEHDVARVKRFGRACAVCDYSPVAGSKWTRRIIEREYEQQALPRIAGLNHVVNAAMLRYELPGVSRISTADLLRLRCDEEAFALWRNNFGLVIDKAITSASDDNEQFGIELRQAAKALLEPAIRGIERDCKASPVLTTLLVPAATTLFGGFMASTVSHTFPMTVLFGTAGAGLGWVAESVRRRLSKPNRYAKVMRQFYGALVPAEG